MKTDKRWTKVDNFFLLDKGSLVKNRSFEVIMLHIFIAFLATFTFLKDRLSAGSCCCGRLDVGPAYLHIDVLESGHTIKDIDMAGFKADGCFIVWKGLCLKPMVLYGRKGHSEIATGGCGLGFCFPLRDNFSITPSVGCNFTQFKTNLHISVMDQFVLHLKERFRSVSPYLSLEACYTFFQVWRLIGCYQYSWSHTHTKIKGMDTVKSDPEGSNYGLMIERDLNDCWSINLGAAYNVSLTKEKHGLRGYGARLGIAYWF